jgi:hypothetical protein
MVEPPADARGSSTWWAINGHAFRLTVWSRSQWTQLEPRPADAQPAPDGSYTLSGKFMPFA